VVLDKSDGSGDRTRPTETSKVEEESFVSKEISLLCSDSVSLANSGSHPTTYDSWPWNFDIQ
jgi:hypothetical protein